VKFKAQFNLSLSVFPLSGTLLELQGIVNFLGRFVEDSGDAQFQFTQKIVVSDVIVIVHFDLKNISIRVVNLDDEVLVPERV